MQINLVGKNIELSEPIKEYVLKRVTNLEKLLSKIEADGGELHANFEVSKATNHHKGGNVFHADCLIKIKGEEFYSSADEEDATLGGSQLPSGDAIAQEIQRYLRKQENGG